MPTQTFTSKALAQYWLKRRETELQVFRAAGVWKQKGYMDSSAEKQRADGKRVLGLQCHQGHQYQKA